MSKRGRAWGLLLSAALLSGASFAACGDNQSSTFDGKDGGGASDGKFGPDVPIIRLGDGGGGDALRGTLAITPAKATLDVKQLSKLPSQTFKATYASVGGSPMSVTPVWSLADYTIGSIDTGGHFTPIGNVGGDVTVVASYGGLTANATVHVLVDIQSNLNNVTLPDGTTISQSSAGISPGDAKALGDGSDAGAPIAEPGPSSGWSTVLYPYDQTVFPRGLLAPIVEFTAGSITPADFKISLDTTDFHWDGFGHIGNPADLQIAMDQSAWDGALLSAQPAPKTKEAVVTLSLVLATGGVAYGPYVAHLIIAPGSLTGVIYYESYGSDVVMSDAGNGGTDFGLWSVKPGSTSPPVNLQSGCVICHGVSASGNTLTTGTDDPTIGYATGVYRIEGDGGYTHLATAPPNLPYAITGAVDSRGLGWGVVSPDGKIVLRGLNQFWGGDQLLGWAVPDSPLIGPDGGVAPLTTTMTIDNGFNMFAPSWAVDEKLLVYINAANTSGGSPGAPSQSVGIVDVAAVLAEGGVPDGGPFGSVTLSSPRTIYDSTAPGSTPAGTYTKVPTFLPDSATIVLEETVDDYSPYNNMLPDYEAGPYVDGTLYALQPSGGGKYTHVPLTNANASYDSYGLNHNYEPHPLPVQVGGYYWVVFASLRQDAYPTLTGPKKLWVTAITPGTAAGKDPSHPPFTLVNQSIVAPQPSQRAFWALAPCLGAGASCTTGSDCCDGSCLPSSSTDPSSPLVCRPPTGMTCAAIGGRCMAGQNADCCNSSSGVECIGTLNGYGTCGIPAPP
jgi:hypothetical protein